MQGFADDSGPRYAIKNKWYPAETRILPRPCRTLTGFWLSLAGFDTACLCWKYFTGMLGVMASVCRSRAPSQLCALGSKLSLTVYAIMSPIRLQYHTITRM